MKRVNINGLWYQDSDSILARSNKAWLCGQAMAALRPDSVGRAERSETRRRAGARAWRVLAAKASIVG